LLSGKAHAQSVKLTHASPRQKGKARSFTHYDVSFLRFIAFFSQPPFFFTISYFLACTLLIFRFGRVQKLVVLVLINAASLLGAAFSFPFAFPAKSCLGTRFAHILPGTTMLNIQPHTRLSDILLWCEQKNASDLHVQPGRRLVVRIHGVLQRIDPNLFPPLSQAEIYQAFEETFPPAVCEQIRSRKETDLSCYHGYQRYRGNFSKQKGEQSFSLRIVPQHRQSLAELRLPSSLLALIDEPRGILLITGPTGQGKSTTARALIQQINETSAMRVITVEDPIEYIFEEYLSQFEQREVGIDTDSFASGIRNAMRQDPNVIFVGELRDKDSIYTAMQAAETGHLVLTTLHADSVPQAIGRIREFYPSSEQDNISSLLARNLNSIICQRLLPHIDGTRVPALEVLKRDRGVQETIQANNLQMLGGLIEAAVGQGMHSMDQYIMQLLADGQITEETARHYSVNKHRLDMVLRGIVTSTAILRPDPIV
jgi:twitching motility protein PilT